MRPLANRRGRVKLSDESSAQRFGRPVRRTLGQHALVRPASEFKPQAPNETPETHFPLQTVTRASDPRFINRYDSHEILLVVDGSCFNNGKAADPDAPPMGGCSFVYKGGNMQVPVTSFPFLMDGTGEVAGTIAFPLEHSGPGGELHDPTSNRAKLRAVIAALEFRPWYQEGWRRIVIATNLKYVVDGAAKWLPKWVKQRWRKGKGKGWVANRDLWEKFYGVMDDLRRNGTEVSFWLITRHSPAASSNMMPLAKCAAQDASRQYDDSNELFTSEFTVVEGIDV